MKVILLDDFHSTINDTLKKWNFEVIDGRGFDTEDLKNHLDINGIFIRSSIPLNAYLLSQFKFLKFISLFFLYDSVVLSKIELKMGISICVS